MKLTIFLSLLVLVSVLQYFNVSHAFSVGCQVMSSVTINGMNVETDIDYQIKCNKKKTECEILL